MSNYEWTREQDGKLPVHFFFFLLEYFSQCKSCLDGYYWPQYGVAPHRHDLSGGSIFGSTRVLEKNQWPEHFEEDPEAPGCGTWYCENKECKNSKEKHKAETV